MFVRIKENVENSFKHPTEIVYLIKNPPFQPKEFNEKSLCSQSWRTSCMLDSLQSALRCVCFNVEGSTYMLIPICAAESVFFYFYPVLSSGNSTRTCIRIAGTNVGPLKGSLSPFDRVHSRKQHRLLFSAQQPQNCGMRLLKEWQMQWVHLQRRL